MTHISKREVINYIRSNSTYVDVMVLKRSCPAVSQICSFTFSPPTSIVLILKSTPIVVMYVPIQDKYISNMLCQVVNATIEYIKIHDRVSCEAKKKQHMITNTCSTILNLFKC